MEQLRESLTRDELITELATKELKCWGGDANDQQQLEGTKECYEDLKIDEYLKNYFEIKSQIDTLTEKLKVENKKIVEMLTVDYKTKKYIGNEYSATVALTDKIKYNDEAELIKILEKDDLLKQYVIKAINTKALNEQIKKSDSVQKKLKESYTTTPQSSLTVKKL